MNDRPILWPEQFAITAPTSGRIKVHALGRMGIRTLCGRYDVTDLDLTITPATFDSTDPSACGNCSRIIHRFDLNKEGAR